MHFRNDLKYRSKFVSLEQIRLEMNSVMLYGKVTSSNQAEMNLRKEIAKSRFPQKKALHNLNEYAKKL